MDCMNELTQTDISKNLHRLIEIRGNITRKDIERMTEAAGVKITSTTLGNFLNEPEERSPWVKTILTLANVLKVEPWMLMIKNFPFEEMGIGKRVKKISPAGYRLLVLFEQATPDQQKSLLDYVSYQLKDSPGVERKVRETQTRYYPMTTYPKCEENHD